MNIVTACKTRPSMAKVRVEVDLLKPLPTSVWVGSEDEESPLNGFTQMVEYEGVPKYCKKLGHFLIECRVLEKKKKQAEQRELERIEEKTQEGNTTVDKMTDEIKEKDKIQQVNQQINNPSDEASSREAVEVEKRKEQGMGKVNETKERQYDKKEGQPENAERDASTKIENAGNEALTNAEKIESTEEDNTMRKRTRRKKKRNGSAKKVAKKKPKGKHNDGEQKKGKAKDHREPHQGRGTSQSRRGSNSRDKSQNGHFQ
nr:glutamic acid-rich protein-like [Nicotiana tomentosiformis]